MADLVFIHGAADSGAIWELQTERFGVEHRVLAIDLPGHGPRLDEPAIDTLDGIADEVIRQLQARGFVRPVLVGHSMGGAAALSIAIRYPDLPSALVLAGSGARLRMRPEVLESARVKAETAPANERAEPEIQLDQVVSPQAASDVRAWLVDRFRQATAQATYADFTAIHSFDALGRLEGIQQPTLVIAGEDDLWTPPRFQHYLAEHLPHVRLVLLPATGHYPFVEQAAAFNQELDRFLADVPSGEAARG
jgi:pimeloyl-ACP methyl ester carboxylesterase